MKAAADQRWAEGPEAGIRAGRPRGGQRRRSSRGRAVPAMGALQRASLPASLLGLLLACRAWGAPVPDSSPALLFGGQVRLRHLYAEDGRAAEAHVEMLPDGAVRLAAARSPDGEWGTAGGGRRRPGGSPRPDLTLPAGLLELKAVKPGIIRILAVRSGRFLCMRPDGQLYGAVHYDASACNFRERLLGDGYNVYTSEAHGRPLRLPPPASPGHAGPSRFLPLPGHPLAGPEPPWPREPEPPDVGSSDPLSMVRGPQGRSPSYAS
ncbi:fibroblast growth factor 21 isoform X1 [Gracilinanus agilis]|uniref:fibroblast growth factor 21 isoform X1 n=1 Tax=Gracilinanus agilis TaxID=191870 RepID=UPI001CFE5EC6|nr:fibroblast growth factor 21 isoform X1 [Gracilinanus agilis]